MEPRISRLLALAILFVAIYTAWTLVAGPVISRFVSYNNSIAQAEAAIMRHRRILLMRDSLEKKMSELSRQEILRNGFVSSGSPELGIAALQGRLKSVIESSQGVLTSLRALAIDADAGSIRVGVRAVASGDISSLVDSFYKIETGWPSLVIDNVIVRARTGRARAARNEITADARLTIEFSVFGLLPGPEAVPLKQRKGRGG